MSDKRNATSGSQSENPDREETLETARHETGEAANTVESYAGEEDPGAAAEDIASLIDEHLKSLSRNH